MEDQFPVDLALAHVQMLVHTDLAVFLMVEGVGHAHVDQLRRGFAQDGGHVVALAERVRRDVSQAKRFETNGLDDIDGGLQLLNPVFGLRRIRCEFMPIADYCGGRYSIWGKNSACAA